MGFDDLPTELLDDIITLISPDDIVAFATINRRVHSLSGERLRQHRDFSASYSKVILDNTHKLDHTISHPIKLLFAIWKEPRIAYYIKHVTFVCNEHDQPLVYVAGSFDQDHEAWLMIEQMDGCKQLLHTNPYFSQHRDHRRACRDEISLGKQIAAFTLLLVSLPNLQRLRFTEADGWDQWMLYSIFTSPICSDPTSGVLSKLTTVETYHLDTEGSTWIEILCLFAQLPSVRTLKGAHTGFNEEINHLPWQQHPSKLERLELSAGVIEPEDLEAALLPMPDLKKFCYYHTGCGNLFDARSLVAVLGKVLGETLELLSLTNDEYDWRNVTQVSSLHGFKKLKTLEIRTQALISNKNTDSTPRLIDILPPTIETVALFSKTYEQQPRRPLHDEPQVQLLLRDIVTEKNKHIPYLAKLVLYNTPDPEYLSELWNVGIEVERMDSSGLPAHARFWQDDPPIGDVPCI